MNWFKRKPAEVPAPEPVAKYYAYLETEETFVYEAHYIREDEWSVNFYRLDGEGDRRLVALVPKHLVRTITVTRTPCAS